MENLKKLETEKFELIERRKDINKRIKERQTKEEKEFNEKKEEVKTQLLAKKNELEKDKNSINKKTFLACSSFLLTLGGVIGSVFVGNVAVQVILGVASVGLMITGFVTGCLALGESNLLKPKVDEHNKEAEKYNAMQFEKSCYLKSLESDLEIVNLKIKNLDTEAKNYVYSIKAKQEAIKTQARINKKVENSKLIKEYNALTSESAKV